MATPVGNRTSPAPAVRGGNAFSGPAIGANADTGAARWSRPASVAVSTGDATRVTPTAATPTAATRARAVRRRRVTPAVVLQRFGGSGGSAGSSTGGAALVVPAPRFRRFRLTGPGGRTAAATAAVPATVRTPRRPPVTGIAPVRLRRDPQTGAARRSSTDGGSASTAAALVPVRVRALAPALAVPVPVLLVVL